MSQPVHTFTTAQLANLFKIRPWNMRIFLGHIGIQALNERHINLSLSQIRAASPELADSIVMVLNNPTKTNLKPILRISELCDRAKVSRCRMLTLLKKAHIPIRQFGYYKARFVYLSDLQNLKLKLQQST